MPIVVERENFGINEEELLHLSIHNKTRSNRTEAEIMENIMRDPILIGVTQRSFGCGIKDKPPIFGKVWKYLPWITETIKYARASYLQCQAEVPDPIQASLAELIKRKGPGILGQRDPQNMYSNHKSRIIDKLTKQFTLDDMKFAQDFDLDVDAVFDIKD